MVSLNYFKSEKKLVLITYLAHLRFSTFEIMFKKRKTTNINRIVSPEILQRKYFFFPDESRFEIDMTNYIFLFIVKPCIYIRTVIHIIKSHFKLELSLGCLAFILFNTGLTECI